VPLGTLFVHHYKYISERLNMTANYPPNIFSMVGDIRKDTITRVATITSKVMAPLFTVTVAHLRFLFSLPSFLLFSASFINCDVVILLLIDGAVLMDLSTSVFRIFIKRSVFTVSSSSIMLIFGNMLCDLFFPLFSAPFCLTI
jgi:hypothetical protein